MHALEIRFLGELRIGERARIRAIDLELGIAQRLLALGVVPGALIKLVHVAPLGDPIAIELNSRRLSLRRDDARRIRVDLLQD